MTLHIDQDGDLLLDGERLSHGARLDLRGADILPFWIPVVVIQPDGRTASLGLRLSPTPRFEVRPHPGGGWGLWDGAEPGWADPELVYANRFPDEARAKRAAALMNQINAPTLFAPLKLRPDQLGQLQVRLPELGGGWV